ncbi:MAG: glucose-6-phosphate isomerase [Deltaproteobacteria bacterium]|nr:glucose-6-phosphate isomerase [Deltaproteobacteria bacterium]
MDGLNLEGLPPNQTVAEQRKREKGGQHPFETPEFVSDNRLVLDLTYMLEAPGPGIIRREDVDALIPQVIKAHQMLTKGQGDIYDGEVAMTGWLDLPGRIRKAYLQDIRSRTGELSEQIDAFVSIGIGGSYLGIEATLGALTHGWFNRLPREDRGGAPEIYFLGQNMDPDFFRDTLDMLAGKRIGINVISKSGTTTETAIAFRIIRSLMEKTWGRKADSLILVTTDQERGALRGLADERGYQAFVIPDNIGGRFSVLTDVGLVGLAMARIDIEEFVAGFRHMHAVTRHDDFWENPSLVHAALRHAAWEAGKRVEVVATNSAPLYGVCRWMEQLFPESEGHQGHGMWVSPAMYSEKLHANGQMVQEGPRNIMETFLLLQNHDNQIKIPPVDTNQDGLDFLVKRDLDMNFVNQKVIHGPAYAHYRGGVPNMTIEIQRRNAFNLGQLYYMLEKSVAVSGFLLGHNPFVQPGVEAYKHAMFALIGKPGFDQKRRDMEADWARIDPIRV